MPQIIYLDSERKPKTGELGQSDVKAAASRGVSLTAYMNAKYSDHNPEHGTVIQQATNTQGIYMHNDAEIGVQSSPLDVAIGLAQSPLMATSFENAASGTPIVSPENSDQDRSVLNRILFGENILAIVDETLVGRRDDMIAAAMGRLVAVSNTFPDGLFVQPKINTREAEDVEGLYGASTQNTLPPTMIGIDLSAESLTIPAYSVGVEITHRAMRRTSIDFLGTIIAAHARGLRFRQMYADLVRILNGNPLVAGEAALPTFTATSLDASIGNTPYALTDLAWYDFLYDEQVINNYDLLICGKQEYRSILNRTGRPENPFAGYKTSAFSTQDPEAINLLQVGTPAVLIVPDGTYPAGTIVAVDTEYAIGEAVDASAQYQGQNDDSLTRTLSMRWDWSRLLYRLNYGGQPFRVMTLT